VNVITFVVARKNSPDGRYPFTILRMNQLRQDVISHHATIDEASEAAARYASQARFAGLDARIYQRDWLLDGKPQLR
jgi:hypothetical protein